MYVYLYARLTTSCQHFDVCDYNFELQQGHAHHTQMIKGCNYMSEEF